MSPRSQSSHAFSYHTQDGLVHATDALSPARSRRTFDPETTPTPSRPDSPIQDLNEEEQQMVNEYLTRPSGTRTSYAPSAMAPSMLEPEIQNTHFHDAELCQLLHALDQPMAEPVKKAIRKAVRARVKKLGMKYDNEVRNPSIVPIARCLAFGYSLSGNTGNLITTIILLYT